MPRREREATLDDLVEGGFLKRKKVAQKTMYSKPSVTDVQPVTSDIESSDKEHCPPPGPRFGPSMPR